MWYYQAITKEAMQESFGLSMPEDQLVFAVGFLQGLNFKVVFLFKWEGTAMECSRYMNGADLDPNFRRDEFITLNLLRK